jgi:hypothetical protein
MQSIINIPVKELNEVCGLPDRKWSTSTYFNLTNRELVHDKFKYQKFQDDFAENIEVVADDKKGFVGTFRPSYEEFLFSILKALNVNTNRSYIDDVSLTDLLHSRINLLKTLPDEAWLYNNFPVLYRNLQNGRKYIKEVEKEKEDPSMSEIAKEDEHYYYACAMRKDLYNFIKCQTESYRRFVDGRFNFKKLIQSKNYNKFIKENYDQDKLAMYLAHKYLTICEHNMDNKSLLNKYVRLLNRYINSDYNKKVSITVNHSIIDFDEINTRFNIIKTRLDQIDGEVEWVLIPEGKREKYVRAGLDPRTHYMTEEEFNSLVAAGEAKEKFYSDNKPLLKAYGRLKYSGYIAYIYPNGEVLLDTEYNKEYPMGAKGNAIYHMKAMYFEAVSGLDKTVLKQHPAVDRIVHAGNWQKKAQAIIDQPGTEEDKEQAKQLVKRIIEQNEKDS